MSLEQNIIESLKSITYQDFLISFINAYEFPAYLTKSIAKEIKLNSSNEFIIDGKFWAVDIKNEINFKGHIFRLTNEPNTISKKIKYIIVFGKDKIAARDIKTRETIEINYTELHKYHDFFKWGFRKSKKKVVEKIVINSMDHLNKIGEFYNELKKTNKTFYKENKNHFNMFISRILFCLYAENSKIFKDKQFTNTIKPCSLKDNENTGTIVNDIFTIISLNPHSFEGILKRKNYPLEIRQFPFINNGFFSKQIPAIKFNNKTYTLLKELGLVDWSKILDKNFGELLENAIKRKEISKPTLKEDVLKVINPLFLDSLKQACHEANNVDELKALLDRIKNIKVFDPACHYGNFLTIAYEELKLLERSIIEKIMIFDNTITIKDTVNLSQFYGISAGSLSANIARLSLYITSTKFKKFNAAVGRFKIYNKKALSVNWNDICNNKGEIYLIGKPPFKGYKTRNEIEKNNFNAVFASNPATKKLDYCACWFMLGARYIQNSKAKLAFILSPDISQGESMAYLWEEIFKLTIKIKFAYSLFDTNYDARSVLIIGLTHDLEEEKLLYSKTNGRWKCRIVDNISPYLKPGPDQLFHRANNPISSFVSPAQKNKKNSFTDYIELSETEIQMLINNGVDIAGLVYKLILNNDFHYSKFKYCGSLKQILDAGVFDFNDFKDKIENGTKDFIECSGGQGNRIIIATSNKGIQDHLIVDIIDEHTMTSGESIIVPNGDMYHFGILSSKMHRVWVDTVCSTVGKSITMYSLRLGYNAFPWPNATIEDKKAIAGLAETVYLLREEYPKISLNDMYYEDKMPEMLATAHYKLDEAVDHLYDKNGFMSVKERLLCLINRYNEVR